MQLIDVFLFNDEFDLLEKRLEYLYEHVDQFVLIEGDRTFGGRDKPFHFEENKERYDKYLNKISNFKFISTDRVIDLARDPWQYEALQRTYIGFCLDSFDPEDIIMVSDLDEIPNRDKLEAIKYSASRCDITQLQYHQFLYNLNTKSDSHGWFAAYAAKKRIVLRQGPNIIRKSFGFCDYELKGEFGIDLIMDAGWHLSYFFPPEDIPRKILDSCLLEYKNEHFLDFKRIKKCINDQSDLFERDNQSYSKIKPKKFFPQNFLEVFNV